MFSIGDKIIYGSEGVYLITEYTTSPIDKNDKRQFYLLSPMHGPAGNVIITPVDNDKVNMRLVMSRDEALTFIDSIPEISILTVEREKSRREIYKATLASGQGSDLISIIKTVRERREICIQQKKRLSDSDSDYEKKAKFCLYGELAVALGITFDCVEEFIKKRLDDQSA